MTKRLDNLHSFKIMLQLFCIASFKVYGPSQYLNEADLAMKAVY